MPKHSLSSLTNAIGRWRDATIAGTLVTWSNPPDILPFADRCLRRAAELLDEPPAERDADEQTARFCIVAKRPHATGRGPLLAILSRLLAFGVHIHAIGRAGDGPSVGEALYPVANAHYRCLPAEPAVWESIDTAFDDDRFRLVFGEAYSRNLVISGAQAIAQFGLTTEELTAIWEEGRTPIHRRTLTDRYGSRVAEVVLNESDEYSWFRGPWPIGIHRITSGLMAFAMRHERLANAPVIVLNGHYPGLADLFDRDSVIVEAGVTPRGPGIDEVRRWVVGHDNRPSSCLPGTIRRDAYDGVLEVDSTDPVDSRRNILHCSDGIVAGTIECRALMGWEECRGVFTGRMLEHGLTSDEIQSIIIADPSMRTADGKARLTELTRGHTLEAVVSTVARVVPPVFGPRNGFASGLTISVLHGQFERLAARGADVSAFSHRDSLIRPLCTRPRHVDELGLALESAGEEVIRRGAVGLIAPAGGTGGRFGSYDAPENHPSRQKALFPAFALESGFRSGLDVRLANARFWRKRTGARVPLAVLGSPTNHEAIETWCSTRAMEGSHDVIAYRQYGTYRVYAEFLAETTAGSGRRWIDAIARRADGTPSLKPPGNLGILTCFVLSGLHDAWSAAGVEIIAVANGDDVGFRLDPRIVGLFLDPDIDAVVVGVPWGVQGQVIHHDRLLNVRGDESGWGRTAAGHRCRLVREADEWFATIDGKRHAIMHPRLETGGSICEIERNGSWYVGIAEDLRPLEGGGTSLYNTNHLYLRVSSLSRVMGLGAHVSRIDAVAEFIHGQPFYAERKLVRLDDGPPVECIQLAQVANDVLRHMRVTPLAMSRSGDRGGYAALKAMDDIVFAQALLDDFGVQGDELLF